VFIFGFVNLHFNSYCNILDQLLCFIFNIIHKCKKTWDRISNSVPAPETEFETRSKLIGLKSEQFLSVSLIYFFYLLKKKSPQIHSFPEAGAHRGFVQPEPFREFQGNWVILPIKNCTEIISPPLLPLSYPHFDPGHRSIIPAEQELSRTFPPQSTNPSICKR
jgi:hypothetical protein